VLGPSYGLIPLTDRNEPVRDLEFARLANPFPVSSATMLDLDDEGAIHHGLLTLTDHGCGAWTALVVTGACRGEMWDYDDEGYRPCSIETGAGGRDRLCFASWYEQWLLTLETEPESLDMRLIPADALEEIQELEDLLDSDPITARARSTELLDSPVDELRRTALAFFCRTATIEDIPTLVELATGDHRQLRLYRDGAQTDLLLHHATRALFRLDTLDARRALMSITLIQGGEEPTAARADQMIALNMSTLWFGRPPKDSGTA